MVTKPYLGDADSISTIIKHITKMVKLNSCCILTCMDTTVVQTTFMTLWAILY